MPPENYNPPSEEFLRAYQFFKRCHREKIEDFSMLMKHMVLQNRLPIDLVLDGKTGLVIGGIESIQTEECNTAWQALLDAADKEFAAKPELCALIKHRLTEEARTAGNALAKSLSKTPVSSNPFLSPSGVLR